MSDVVKLASETVIRLCGERWQPKFDRRARRPGKVSSYAPTDRLTTRQAAAYLGMSKSTLEKLRVKGGGPRFIKRGRSIRYLVADLDAWDEANKRASTSDLGRPRLRRVI